MVFLYSRYELSSSSGDSSPELSPLNKRANYRPSSASAAASRAKKQPPPLDASPGYNSSEEYDGSHGRYTYLDHEVCTTLCVYYHSIGFGHPLLPRGGLITINTLCADVRVTNYCVSTRP